MAAAPAAGANEIGALVLSGLTELAPELAVYSMAQVALFVPVFVLVRRGWPQQKDHWILADSLVSLTVFPLMTLAAVLGSWRLRSDVDARWSGSTPEGRFFLMLYVTRILLHIPVQSMQHMSRSHLLMMTVHHLLSAICMGMGLITSRMQFWGCLDGCCEMSTIFLNNLYLVKAVTINGKDLKEIIPSWLYMANGICLWFSFLVFRILLFPTWLYFWYRDVEVSPAETWDRSNALEKYLYPSVNVVLLGLSSLWFVPVTKGMMKAIGLSGGKDDDTPKAD